MIFMLLLLTAFLKINGKLLNVKIAMRIAFKIGLITTKTEKYNFKKALGNNILKNKMIKPTIIIAIIFMSKIIKAIKKSEKDNIDSSIIQ